MTDQPARPSRKFAYNLAIQATLRDTDGLGHVNNGVYLSWFEEVRTRYIYERRGLSRLEQIDFILASTVLEFRSPVRLHEFVDLWCVPSRIGNSSWELTYEGRSRSDGRLVVEGRSVQVQFDYGKGATAPIPDDWRALLETDLVREG